MVDQNMYMHYRSHILANSLYKKSTKCSILTYALQVTQLSKPKIWNSPISNSIMIYTPQIRDEMLRKSRDKIGRTKIVKIVVNFFSKFGK